MMNKIDFSHNITIFINMNELKNTIIEENFPAIRRKSLTTFETLVKNTICDTFITFADEIHPGKPSLKES